LEITKPGDGVRSCGLHLPALYRFNSAGQEVLNLLSRAHSTSFGKCLFLSALASPGPPPFGPFPRQQRLVRKAEVGYVVEEAVRSAPDSIAIHNRKGDPALLLEGSRSYWGPGSDTPFVFDPFAGQRRQTCLDDVHKATLLVDHLDNYDFVMCMGVAHELPQSIADKYHFVEMASNTAKPLVFTAASRGNLADIYQMACAIAGGEGAFRQKLFIIHYTEPIAPLIHPRGALDSGAH